jgi:hypothetical protein
MQYDHPTITTVPASSGWHLSALYCGADQLTDEPVIAWEITRYDARPKPNSPGRREPIRRYLTPICTNDAFNANAGSKMDGWLLRDPTGRYHDMCGRKFETTDEALVSVKIGCGRREQNQKIPKSGGRYPGREKWVSSSEVGVS